MNEGEHWLCAGTRPANVGTLFNACVPLLPSYEDSLADQLEVAFHAQPQHHLLTVLRGDTIFREEVEALAIVLWAFIWTVAIST